jgi:uncharacterized membrane protein
MRNFILAVAAALTLLSVSAVETNAQQVGYSAHRHVTQRSYTPHSYHRGSSYHSPHYSGCGYRPPYHHGGHSGHGYYPPKHNYYSGQRTYYSGSYRSGRN